MKPLFILFTLFSSFFLKEKIYEPPSTPQLPNDTVYKIMKALYTCYDAEVDLEKEEWPFQHCFQNKNCPDQWKCSSTCACEPQYSFGYEYIFSGFKESQDDKEILLELKVDRNKVLVLPVREEAVFEKYKEGDEIRIFESTHFTYSMIKKYSYPSYEIYNINLSPKEIVRSLYQCNYDQHCQEKNHNLVSGKIPQDKWHLPTDRYLKQFTYKEKIK